MLPAEQFPEIVEGVTLDIVEECPILLPLQALMEIEIIGEEGIQGIEDPPPWIKNAGEKLFTILIWLLRV